MKQIVIISAFLGFVLLFGCMNKKKMIGTEEIIDVDSLILDKHTRIILVKDGFYKLDSNAVLPKYDSTLKSEYLFVKELIESRTNFKTKAEWKIGNDSPSDGIWLNDSMDTTIGFYAINTTEGCIAIYGSSKEAIRDGILMLKSLFVKAFQENEKRDIWYLPLIIIEHKK
jgi:hypothetical protein